MDIAIDTEFLEDGKMIRLISIGLVAGDGRELYCVSADEHLAEDAVYNRWLRDNVVPSLPIGVEYTPGAYYGDGTKAVGGWHWDTSHPDWKHVKPQSLIAREVRDFILGDPASEELPYVELWADYGAYDHVALCQLWGRMIDLPEGVPMWTHDLRQEAERLGVAKGLPSLPDVTEHNALSDAREVMHRLKWLRQDATAERCTQCGSGSAFWEPQHRKAV